MSKRIEEENANDIVKLIPADGWCEVYREDDTGKIVIQPLVGWGLTKIGDVVPITTDIHGYIESEISGVLYHPKQAYVEEWPSVFPEPPKETHTGSWG